MTAATERAVLAGGCFWGMQVLLRHQPGVLATRVGYTGGDIANATYRHHGSHAEAVEIVFDPQRIDYRQLLEFFFRSTTRPRATARATTSAAATARRSSTPARPRSASPRTPSPTSTPPACGPARW